VRDWLIDGVVGLGCDARIELLRGSDEIDAVSWMLLYVGALRFRFGG